MRIPLPFIFSAAAVVSCLGFSSCATPSRLTSSSHASVVAKTDFPVQRMWRIKSYTFNHIWAGHGYNWRHEPGKQGQYRAKLTLFTEGKKDPVELYFIDPEWYQPATTLHRNPPPSNDVVPEHLYFPLQTLGPILEQLEMEEKAVWLKFGDGEWAIETTNG